jgi:hypothetical protein
MFESLFSDDASTRLRAAGVPPLAAFLAALGYLTIYPTLPRVPAALFWSVVLVLAAGAILGAVKIIRVLRSDRVRGRAFGWLAGSAALTLACALSALSMTFPWLL